MLTGHATVESAVDGLKSGANDYLRVGIPIWFIANVVIVLLVAVYWSFRGFGGLPGF
jgi:hypothetical protein